MLINTNNKAESSSRELKTKKLADYKKYSLSEMLKVVKESSLPQFNHHYVELNTRYSDESKKHQRSLPTYLRNRPRNNIDHFIMRKGAVDHAMVISVELRNCYSVKSSALTELKKKEYLVDAGNEQRYCSCTCPDFKNKKKRVHHETLESLHNSVRSLQIDLRVTLKEFNDLTYIVKNEDVLKIARNEIGNLARTVKV